MEERDVQIRGYRIRLPLDVFVVASAPTPRTTPTAAASSRRSRTATAPRSAPTTRRTTEHEIDIMEQERSHFEADDDRKVNVPQYMKEIVAEITPPRPPQPRHQPALRRLRARLDRRLRVACWPTPCAAPSVSARTRSCRASATCPTSSRRSAARSSSRPSKTAAKSRSSSKLIQGAVLAVFNRYFNLGELEPIVTRFKAGVRRRSRRHDARAPTTSKLAQADRRPARPPSRSSARTAATPADRLRRRVHPRRPAPEQAAEQGQGRRPIPVPRLGLLPVPYRCGDGIGERNAGRSCLSCDCGRRSALKLFCKKGVFSHHLLLPRLDQLAA